MPIDTTRPELNTPAAGSTTAIAANGNLVLVFNEAIQAGSGKIYLSDGGIRTYFSHNGTPHTRIVGASDLREIDIHSSQVTISGNTLTINPTADLIAGVRYSIVMGNGVVTDLANNAFSGISDTATLAYQAASSLAAPAITSIRLSSDTGLSNSDRVTSAVSQTLNGNYSGSLASGTFIQVSLDNGTTWQNAAVNAADSSWSVAGTLSSAGTILARISGGGAVLTQSYLLDQSAPTVSSVSLGAASLVAGSTTTVTVTMSEAVSGLDDEDFSVVGGVIEGSFSSTDGGLTWTATLRSNTGQTGPGTVTFAPAQGRDVAGNLAGGTATATFTLTAPPSDALPVLAGIALSMDSGADDTDLITNMAVGQTISGSFDGVLAAGMVLQLSLGGGVWHTVSSIDHVNGTWSYSGVTLDASGTISARVVDGGGAPVATASGSYTVDATGPALTATTPDEGDTVAGSLAALTLQFNEALTVDAATVFTLKSADNSDVRTFSGAQLNYNSASHAMTLNLASALQDGKAYTLYASNGPHDVAGNAAYATDAAVLGFQTTAGVVVLNPGFSITDTGASSTDGVTSATTLTVGNLVAGGHWKYSLNGGSTWLTGSGSSLTLAEGSYTAGQIRLQQWDAAENPSGVTSVGALTIDTTAPSGVFNYGGAAFSSDIVLSASALSGGARLQYTVNNGASWQDASLESGVWHVHGASIASGGLIGVRISDLAGNIASASVGGVTASEAYFGDNDSSSGISTGFDTVVFANDGDDTVLSASGQLAYAHAGDGNDIFVITGTGRILNVTAMEDYLEEFETISLGAGNTLFADDVAAVAAISEGTLTIEGSASSTVNIGNGDWLLGLPSGGYTVYLSGGVHLRVDADITIVGTPILAV